MVINGEQKEIKEDSTILDILKEFKVDEKTMAVAVNMHIVKKEEWKRFKPKEGDKIEFLGFTGGG